MFNKFANNQLANAELSSTSAVHRTEAKVKNNSYIVQIFRTFSKFAIFQKTNPAEYFTADGSNNVVELCRGKG